MASNPNAPSAAMTVLIVDDENSTRQALRELLSAKGFGPILEAKNGVEACKILDQEKSKVRLIIADWEMPYLDGLKLCAQVGGREALDLAPFLLITSDLPKSKIDSLRAENPRLDGCLLKPFRADRLEAAIFQAAREHGLRRKGILALSPPQGHTLGREEFPQASGHHWRWIDRVSTVEAFVAGLERNFRELGALLIDPPTDPAEISKLAAALSQFKKTPHGTQTPVALLTREASRVYPFRILGQFFFPGVESTDEVLSRLSARVRNSWETERVFSEGRCLLKAGQPRQALAATAKLQALDAFNSEVFALAAEARVASDELEPAVQSYLAAISANPCSARSYIKLAELAKSDQALLMDRKIRGALAGSAEYCPENVDVLVAVARFFAAAGDEKAARAIAEQALRHDPSHEGARNLVQRS